MNLSEHFTFEELTFSEVALRSGIPNVPSDKQIQRLSLLCEYILEPIRELLNVPIHVNSGYRAPIVNTAVHGAAKSAHLDGRAADIVPIGFPLRDAFDVIRLKKSIPLDQIILECNAWIHVAIAPDDAMPRYEALLASGKPGLWTYERVS